MSEHEELKHEGLFDGGDTTVTLTLDDGSTMECVVLTIFEAGNEGKEYIAVLILAALRHQRNVLLALIARLKNREYHGVRGSHDF